jgi:hypothetical protein
VTRAGKRIDLQPREFRLLEYLMRNSERVVLGQIIFWTVESALERHITTQESEKKVVGEIEHTRDTLLSELEEARKLALKRGQASAAAQCTMGKAKILGLIIDRREVDEVGKFDSWTDEQLVAEATRLARSLGIDGPRLVEDDNKKSL